VGLVAGLGLSNALAQTREHDPAPARADLEQLATRFTCTETVAVERIRGERIERATVGAYGYLLALPRKARDLPYRFVEQRTPPPRGAVLNRIEQPVPLSWLTLDLGAAGGYRPAGSCAAETEMRCEAFEGTLSFRDGRDPREWSGKVWRDAQGRIRRIEAVPQNQGERRDRLVGRPESSEIGGIPGPGRSAELPTFRVDGTVEEIRCEIEFDELLPGRLLPVRADCHRDSVRPSGKRRERWSLSREFSDCREFGVETREELHSE